jgi:hypothetical protein
MIKKLSGLLLILLFSAQLSFAGGNIDQWPALKALHGVISQTFHPSEEGNLVPVKARAKELYTKAQALLKSKVPAAFNSSQVKEAVVALEKEAKKLQEMVTENDSDTEIKEQLSVVHDTFHEIVGLCTKEDGHDHE